MPLRSMTGFGAAAVETDRVRASVSVRGVNHRFLDVAIHVPRRLQGLEAEIKRRVQGRVTRGRVDVSIQAVVLDAAAHVAVAPGPLVAGVVGALRQMKADHHLAGEVAVTDVARFPGMLEITEPLEGPSAADLAPVLAALDQALEGVEAMRRAEGASLATLLEDSLRAIEAAATRVERLSEEGRAARREALAGRARELVQELGLDEGRLYQEIARMAEKADVAEEVGRLKSHVEQARAALAADGASGRRLDFLAQELAREANTIGSKAASAALVHEVVALKGEVERLREQVQNVE
ncbi:MAG TPA: YicC/YloC family endoribonuclease [Vicinamibacteria bacterium]|nr:YicC/YloC family endoribonuclease [Vicinamibacteria bacterium]